MSILVHHFTCLLKDILTGSMDPRLMSGLLVLSSINCFMAMHLWLTWLVSKNWNKGSEFPSVLTSLGKISVPSWKISLSDVSRCLKAEEFRSLRLASYLTCKEKNNLSQKSNSTPWNSGDCPFLMGRTSSELPLNHSRRAKISRTKKTFVTPKTKDIDSWQPRISLGRCRRSTQTK